ncbi:hypothetical protein AMTRI_Chr10g7650 [Amborella trichopoda]
MVASLLPRCNISAKMDAFDTLSPQLFSGHGHVKLPFLNPLTWYMCRVPIQNVCRNTRRAGLVNHFQQSPLMSTRKASIQTTIQGSCEVLWSIQADLEDGQLLYITGDTLALGGWDPALAILMYPCEEEANVWQTEIEVPWGVNIRYNYFVKEDSCASCDIVWRPGPLYSLSVPCSFECSHEKIIVKDIWMKAKVEGMPLPSWGSWLVETDHLIQLAKHQTLCAGTSDLLEMLKCESSEVNTRLDDSSSSELSCKESSSLDFEELLFFGDLGFLNSSKRDEPVEEPWFPESSLSIHKDIEPEMDSLAHYEDLEQVSADTNMDSLVPHEGLELFEDASMETLDDRIMDFLVPHQDIAEEVSKFEINKEQPVSTVIVINSSVCTMQRVAVLEDGKLVELLLEPVKNNVQCGNVYLGVVTKLVPHMGGAFVDIGISRPSLMEIKRNREPYAFPPFCTMTKEGEGNVSFISDLKERSHTHSIAMDLHDEDEDIDDFLEAELQDESLPLIESSELHDEPLTSESFQEHGLDNKYGNLDPLNKKTNGVHVFNDSPIGETNFDEYVRGNGHLVGAHSKSLLLETENFDECKISHHTQPQEDLPIEAIDSNIEQNKWANVSKGTKVLVQVVKEGLGTKGPTLTAYPNLKSRFWVLSTRCNRVGVSKKISGVERTRLKLIAKTLQPPGFGLTVRTVAAGHTMEELQKDLEGLVSTWKDIVEHATSASLAADEGVEGAVPVILHKAMGQTLSVVQDYFNDKVEKMVLDSPRTYHEVTSYLQEVAPDLCNRVELCDKRVPIFDEYGIEEEIDNMLSKRVPLTTGGSLIIEQTEALVSIDVNGGLGMLGEETSQEQAILEVNLAAAKQIARELRLRDIGGIIVVDFIDMVDDMNKRLVYDEIKRAVERDRSLVRVSELSRHGLMEITRKRVRPSVTFMISEPCSCCHATGRVEALETSFSKIEREICRLLATMRQKPKIENVKSWPRFILRVDRYMCNYLTSGKRTKLADLSSSLKVWILLKVARGFARGAFEVKPFADDKGSEKNQQQVDISRLKSTEVGPYITSGRLTLFPVKKLRNRG